MILYLKKLQQTDIFVDDIKFHVDYYLLPFGVVSFLVEERADLPLL
jgi:hypothetical protein